MSNANPIRNDMIPRYPPILFALSNDFDLLNPSALLNHVILRVKKMNKIGRLGYTTADIHGESVMILFDGPIRMQILPDDCMRFFISSP